MDLKKIFYYEILPFSYALFTFGRNFFLGGLSTIAGLSYTGGVSCGKPGKQTRTTGTLKNITPFRTDREEKSSGLTEISINEAPGWPAKLKVLPSGKQVVDEEFGIFYPKRIIHFVALPESCCRIRNHPHFCR